MNKDKKIYNWYLNKKVKKIKLKIEKLKNEYDLLNNIRLDNIINIKK